MTYTITEIANINRAELNKLIPLWSKYYKINVTDINLKQNIVQIKKNNHAVYYYLCTGSYYDYSKFTGGKIEINKIHTLFKI